MSAVFFLSITSPVFRNPAKATEGVNSAEAWWGSMGEGASVIVEAAIRTKSSQHG